MTNKWTLDTGSMKENFFSDAVLIGIASPLIHYRFCWTLNNFFDIKLVREPDLDIYIKTASGKETYFPVYQYHLPLNGGRHIIYKLKSGDDSLLHEVKQLDYLWLIQTNDSESDSKYIIGQLRNINDVQLAQLLIPERLKNIDHLLI